MIYFERKRYVKKVKRSQRSTTERRDEFLGIKKIRKKVGTMRTRQENERVSGGESESEVFS